MNILKKALKQFAKSNAVQRRIHDNMTLLNS